MREKNGALIWAAVGLFLLPTALAPAGVTLFGLARPTGTDSAVMALTIIWLTVYFILSLSKIKSLFGKDYSWEVNSQFAWPAYRDLFLLLFLCVTVYVGSELGLEYLGYSECVFADYDDGSYTTIGNCDQVWPTASGIWGWLSVIGSLENYVRWFSFLMFVILSFPILDRYFLCIECWISAVHSLLETRISHSAEVNSSAVQIEAAKTPSTSQIRARYLSNIRSCNNRIYLSIISMLLLLLMGIYSFVVVFQGSPTSKALNILTRIESSPALFVADFQSKIREADRALAEIGRPLREVGPNSYASLDDYSESLKSTQSNLVNVLSQLELYFDKIIVEGSRDSDIPTALEDLREIKREIEAASETNWDLVVVRTAIVLISFFALRIFFRVFESAIAERRTWEEKLSAVILIHSEDFKVAEFLALTGKHEERAPSDLMDGELEKLLSHLRELKRPSP